ncbi:peroxiredoxin [Candidatus Woesebacteria bacterium]|nr:peroxiredoxin [Candidatus Woesebacteria bacterium]
MIELHDQAGNTVSLQQLLGKPVVLYFYPKDDTPGCTKEACDFRDITPQLEKLGVQVIGVSADSVESHAKFAQKHSLPFPLWSDPEKKLLTEFGATTEKSIFGKKFIGVKRMTFVLDKSGKVIKVWENVNPLTHAQEVLDFFKL